MARGVNKVILIGTLGQDPETKTSNSGTSICTVSVATNESWKDKQTGEKQERTEWHRVKFFGRSAEIAGEYLRKGSSVYIEGKLRTEKWTDKEGVERYQTNVICDEFQMIGKKGEGENKPSGENSYASAKGNSRPPARRTDMPARSDFDDEIPF